MSNLILPAGVRSPKKAERVGVEVHGNDQGQILMVFERAIEAAIYTPQEAAQLAQALARAAQDQARHGGNPLKGIN